MGEKEEQECISIDAMLLMMKSDGRLLDFMDCRIILFE
jgi:hypothetical protein